MLRILYCMGGCSLYSVLLVRDRYRAAYCWQTQPAATTYGLLCTVGGPVKWLFSRSFYMQWILSRGAWPDLPWPTSWFSLFSTRVLCFFSSSRVYCTYIHIRKKKKMTCSRFQSQLWPTADCWQTDRLTFLRQPTTVYYTRYRVLQSTVPL